MNYTFSQKFAVTTFGALLGIVTFSQHSYAATFDWNLRNTRSLISLSSRSTLDGNSSALRLLASALQSGNSDATVEAAINAIRQNNLIYSRNPQFYSSVVSPDPVPEPAEIGGGVLGLGFLWLLQRRLSARRRRSVEVVSQSETI
jgi:hypothetical protein